MTTLFMIPIDRSWTDRGLQGGKEFAQHIVSSYTPEAHGCITVFFTGYDDDPREVYQVPEVIEFCKGFIQEDPPHVWPYLIDEMPAILEGRHPPIGLLYIISFAFPDLVIVQEGDTSPGIPKKHSNTARIIDIGKCELLAKEIKGEMCHA